MRQSTSVLLGDYFDDFISREVSSGRYDSPDKVIRTALRLLEAEEFKKQLLNEALHQGENCGFVKDFDPKAHLEELNKAIL